MAVQYVSDPFTYTTGGVAAGVQIAVVLGGTSIKAAIWHDAAGTRAPNPLPTNGLGILSFWADPGSYDLKVNGLTFPIALTPTGGGGGEGGAGTYVHTQTTPAATWTISHVLATRPSVDVMDSNGNQIYVETDWPDDATVVITLPNANAVTYPAKVYLRT